MSLKKTNLPCPCGKSSDAYAIQNSEWGRCFSCSKNFKLSDGENPIEHTEKEETEKNFSPLPTTFRAWPLRGLSEDTIRRYKVSVAGEDYEAKYPLYDIETGRHVGNKVRKEGKKFFFEGSAKAGLFGRHAFPPGSAKAVTVTEGQDDAMAVYQMMGSKYPAVSVHSASSAERDCRNDFEYLNSFDKIYLCFDADEPGAKAARAVANLPFPLGKVHIVSLRKHKDPNDYLKAKESEAFVREWWQGAPHKPDGLKLGEDMWEEIISRKESFTVQYPWEGLNKLTYGIRLSEMVIVTADTGVGKTSFLKHIEHMLLTHPAVIEKDYGVGFLHLEEPNGDTALGLLSIENSKPYHLPDTERPLEELRKAYDKVLNNSRAVIWDHFGSNSVDAVIDKVRHMAALGCRYIVLDHLSIVVSDQSGDERRQLDEIATKLKTLTMELDIAVIAVIHTNRQGQIRGTAGVEQLANIVLRLERDKIDSNEWRRNITKVTVEKNRFCGRTGPATYLFYNEDTARLKELDTNGIQAFEDGQEMTSEHIPF